MSDEKPNEPPTRTVEVAVGPNPDGQADQARLAHGHQSPTVIEKDADADAARAAGFWPVKEN